jgi:hypothetical protein
VRQAALALWQPALQGWPVLPRPMAVANMTRSLFLFVAVAVGDRMLDQSSRASSRGGMTARPAYEPDTNQAQFLSRARPLPPGSQRVTSADRISSANTLTVLSFHIGIYTEHPLSLWRLYEIAFAPISISYAPAGQYLPRVKARRCQG